MAEHIDRAMFLFQRSRFDLAEQELRQSLANEPESPIAHALLALCLSEREQHAEARGEAEQAITLAPGVAFVHYTLATVLNRNDRTKEAEAAINESIRLDPESADSFALLAGIRLQQRRWDDALQAADQGLAVEPEHIGCANLRAMALVHLGRKEEAAGTIEGALAKQPENALSHANQGWALLHQGDHRQALEHFREALRIDPGMEWARVGIVEALKARHLLYRLMLRYFLWMSRASGKAQWVVILGVLVAPTILRDLGQSAPWAALLAGPLIVLILGFAFLTWVADPLFNLLLRLNKFGRYALSDEQVSASNWVGLCVLGAVVAPLPMLLTAGPIFALFALGFFLLMILPVSILFRSPKGWPRLVMTVYTVGLAGLGLTGLALPWLAEGIGLERAQTLAPNLLNGFMLGVVLSTWLGMGLTRNQ
ncbi:MAG: tetratricopeptide repeat protein [Isosphaeraceae bacterium]